MREDIYARLTAIIEWLKKNSKIQQSDFIKRMLSDFPEGDGNIRYEYKLFTQLHIIHILSQPDIKIEIPWTDAKDMADKIEALTEVIQNEKRS